MYHSTSHKSSYEKQTPHVFHKIKEKFSSGANMVNPELGIQYDLESKLIRKMDIRENLNSSDSNEIAPCCFFTFSVQH